MGGKLAARKTEVWGGKYFQPHVAWVQNHNERPQQDEEDFFTLSSTFDPSSHSFPWSRSSIPYLLPPSSSYYSSSPSPSLLTPYYRLNFVGEKPLQQVQNSSVLLLDSFSYSTNMFEYNISVAIAEDWWNSSTSIYSSFCGLVIILWKGIVFLDNICLLYCVALVQWLADIGGRGDMQIYALLFSPSPTFIPIQYYFLFWKWG